MHHAHSFLYYSYQKDFNFSENEYREAYVCWCFYRQVKTLLCVECFLNIFDGIVCLCRHALDKSVISGAEIIKYDKLKKISIFLHLNMAIQSAFYLKILIQRNVIILQQ